ncbi:MAG: hypothetical protein JW809_00625 [Pirellulales bacterium]|nr:hypothetical protein [Pirellulales bacterium]
MGKGNLTTQHKWLVALLVGLPLALILWKYGPLPGGGFLREHLSLSDVPERLHRRLIYVSFVPLGALLVVFCRLTLGIRVLGPFRSILLAVAFQFTGIVMGLVFLAVAIGAIVGIRPLLKAMKLPYFGRVSVLLSLMSVIIIATLLLAEWCDSAMLLQVSHFPIIVLCLMGDGFARTLLKEGPRSALWRGATTAVIGIVLTLISQTPWVRQLLLMNPELLLLQIGGIVVISEFLDLRLLAWMNPAAMSDEDGEEGVLLGEPAGLKGKQVVAEVGPAILETKVVSAA